MTSAPTSKRRRGTRGQSGQAYAEFALILPVLLLIVLGIVQFGSAFQTYITLTDATRVGARQAAVSRSLPAADRVPTIKSKMNAAAVSLDTSKMTITITPWDPVNNVEDWVPSGDVTVRASYPFKINLFGLVIFDTSINSRTTERVE